ncbi:polycomb group RING finger protein 3-like isoform X2 [Antedon mediterranea]|uniref:polycomb group RING finger protein 3-like isoform X2 n=1 Tax=Antedon mediterranea TaxID=105859 RepID=UPI003AF7F3A2
MNLYRHLPQNLHDDQMKLGQQVVLLREINDQITCRLCDGYLIDATTITECLHTFCKSCLVKYLEENVKCPICDIVIHQSHPLNYIGFDRTMQDIVYKLVPGLQKREEEQEKEFFDNYGKNEEEEKSETEKEKELEDEIKEEEGDYHRNDDQVKIQLERNTENWRQLRKKYIRISSQATITHLKKLLAYRLKLEKHTEVDILCNEEILGKDHSLEFVSATRWRSKIIKIECCH